MEQQELKDNLCVVDFHCMENSEENKCVHHKTKKRCKFFNDWRCMNHIAHIQAINRYLKHIGLDITWKNQIKDVEVEKAKEEFIKQIHSYFDNNVALHNTMIEKFSEFCNKIGV